MIPNSHVWMRLIRTRHRYNAIISVSTFPALFRPYSVDFVVHSRHVHLSTCNIYLTKLNRGMSVTKDVEQNSPAPFLNSLVYTNIDFVKGITKTLESSFMAR